MSRSHPGVSDSSWHLPTALMDCCSLEVLIQANRHAGVMRSSWHVPNKTNAVLPKRWLSQGFPNPARKAACNIFRDPAPEEDFAAKMQKGEAHSQRTQTQLPKLRARVQS